MTPVSGAARVLRHIERALELMERRSTSSATHIRSDAPFSDMTVGPATRGTGSILQTGRPANIAIRGSMHDSRDAEPGA